MRESEEMLLGGSLSLTSSIVANSDLIEIDAPARFRRQPRPILAEKRVTYRLAVLTLTLRNFRGTTGSIEHLHLLSWAMRSRRGRATLLAWWDGRRFADTVTERLDPNLVVTLNLAVTYGLVRFHGRRVSLTEQGASLAERIEMELELLRTEKAFLERIAPLSDALIRRRLTAAVS